MVWGKVLIVRYCRDSGEIQVNRNKKWYPASHAGNAGSSPAGTTISKFKDLGDII
jgi:hypothetical protein